MDADKLRGHAVKLRAFFVAWLFGVFLCAAANVNAQVGQGTVTGTVYDSSGALVADATVVLTDTDNGTSRSAKSDGRGYFSFVNLTAATYSVEIDVSGFAPMKRTAIEVHIADQIEIKNIVLKPLSVSQTVTVEATQDVVPTTSGEQSYTLDAKEIQNLNIEGRSAIELLGLIPGAANAGNFNSDRYQAPVAGFGQNASAFSVNGNRFDQIAIVSDGSPVTDVQTAGASAVTPNSDMIEELTVQTAAFSSEQPNGPVVVQTETKSGGRDFHGEVYFTARNHALDDTDSRVKSLQLAKPNDSFYYPGFTIGGPVLLPGTEFNRHRDKLFFFFGFEKDIQNVQDPLLDIREAVVPTADQRTGNFSDAAYMASLQNAAYYTGTTPCIAPYNTAYCSAPGIINSADIDPGGKALLNLFPLPNANPAVTGGYNYISSYVLSQPRDQELLRVDYNISDRNHISAHYNHEGEQVPFPYGYFDNFTLSPYPASPTTNNHSNSVTANLATSFGPTLTNELSFTLTRLVYGFALQDQSAVLSSAVGYPYSGLYPNATGLVPNVQFGGGNAGAGSIYLPAGFYPNYKSGQQIFNVSDSVSKVIANHVVKVGVYFARQSFNKLTQGNNNGTIGTEEYYDDSYLTGNSFADLLVGEIGSYSQSTANIMAHMVQRRTDFFIQDTWKATKRLTLNYGLRVDHIGWWYDSEGRMVVFDPALYNPSAPISDATGLVNHATDPSVPRSGSQPAGFQPAPSGGFAYDIFGTGKTIVRGGAGTNYYIDPGQNAYSALQAPPNETFSPTFYASSQPFTLANLSTELANSGNVPNVYGIADQHDSHVPVTYSYNLSVGQALSHSFRIEASYTGNTSRHLLGYNLQNFVPEGCELLGGVGQAIGYNPGNYNDQLCRPYANLDSLSTEEHNLNSSFNSAQITASYPQGPINFWVTYTFGKTLADNCENPFDEHRCYGPAPFDQSQALNISYFIKLPALGYKYFGENKVAKAFLDGWQISGIESFASGSPLDISGATNGNEYDGFHNRTINFYGVGDATNGYNSPNFDSRVIVGTPDEAAVPTLVCNPAKNLKPGQYFNPDCFQAPTPGANSTSPSLGTYNIPYIHGPRFENDEIGVFKNFKMSEAKNLQIRAQAFDFLNRALPTFIQYDSNLYLHYDAYGALPVNASTAGIPTTKIGARTIQLSAKFYF